MDIYIKPKKKASLLNRKEILIGDVAEIIGPKKIEKMKLQTLNQNETNYVVSVTDIIRRITDEIQNATVSNVGETDTWVHATWRKKRPRPLFLWARVAAISLILFFGASTAIMSFHTDGQISKIFERWHLLIFGFEQTNPPIIAIPYSIGLAAGIIFFYNHFLGKKITDDPTPIEVEVETYENDVTETILAQKEAAADAD
ncbi:MAG: stage V sporulation protein AA [Defluviitaleaceae bacterium]|nr:stage V sporulation protein AA [Defluviitaleaceae bacterium]